MKTLHRIYLRNYYKSVAVCYLCTGLFLVVFTFATGLLKAIGAALCVFALLAPMLFLNNQFYRNIPHLINRPYSKKELLLFFLLERTIKAFSTFFPLIIAVFFMDTLESSQIGHYELYILISSFLIINYVLPTIGLKKAFHKSFYNLYYKKYKSKITYIILTFLILSPNLFQLTDENATTSFLLCVFFVAIMISLNFCHLFSLQPIGRFFPKSIIIGIASITPLVSFLHQDYNDLKNKNLSSKDQVEKILSLWEFSPEVPLKKRMALLKESPHEEYGQLLDLGFGDQLKFSELLFTVDSLKKVRKVWPHLPKVDSDKKLQQYISTYKRLNPENKKIYIKFPKIEKKFIKSDLGRVSIKKLFKSKDYPSILIGTFLARFYLPKKEAIELISSIENQNFKSDKYIKRSISSLEKNIK
jgi:hypothetical protein